MADEGGRRGSDGRGGEWRGGGEEGVERRGEWRRRGGRKVERRTGVEGEEG